MKIKFSKMQATGNDFVIIDAREIEIDWHALSIELCNRHFGIGADGIILILPSIVADFRMRIFNADGSEAQICGNGIRCFVKHVIDKKLVDRNCIAVETLAGIKYVEAYLKDDKVIGARVNMGTPIFKSSLIPVTLAEKEPIIDYPINIADRLFKLSIVSMGNPHAVCFLEESVDKFPLSVIGPLVENHKIFPQRTNLEIVNIMSDTRLKARVWERGVGETLACGSGACAIGVISMVKALTKNNVDIILPGGVLTITWDGKSDVFLTGTVKEVFSGEYCYEISKTS